MGKDTQENLALMLIKNNKIEEAEKHFWDVCMFYNSILKILTNEFAVRLKREGMCV